MPLQPANRNPFAQAIVRRFELEGYFSLVGGATLDETRTKKAEVIAHVLAQLGLSGPEGVLMVGDRKHDVLGAAATASTPPAFFTATAAGRS